MKTISSAPVICYLIPRPPGLILYTSLTQWKVRDTHARKRPQIPAHHSKKWLAICYWRQADALIVVDVNQACFWWTFTRRAKHVNVMTRTRGLLLPGRRHIGYKAVCVREIGVLICLLQATTLVHCGPQSQACADLSVLDKRSASSEKD